MLTGSSVLGAGTGSDRNGGAELVANRSQ
jgi:hypothetical protein